MFGFDLYDAIHETDAELASRIIFITGDTLTSSTQARIAQLGNPNLANDGYYLVHFARSGEKPQITQILFSESVVLSS